MGSRIANLENHSVGFLAHVKVTPTLEHTTPNPCNMSDGTKEPPQGNSQTPLQDLGTRTDTEQQHQQVDNLGQAHSSKLVRFYAHPWTQILLISFICFCLPGVSDTI
jgi:hypothetical protein